MQRAQLRELAFESQLGGSREVPGLDWRGKEGVCSRAPQGDEKGVGQAIHGKLPNISPRDSPERAATKLKHPNRNPSKLKLANLFRKNSARPQFYFIDDMSTLHSAVDFFQTF
eukprot:6437066-Amphidinium_carterae.1